MRNSLFYVCLIFIIVTINCNNVITNPTRTDGFGAQFLHIIASVIYAELQGIKFVYTPFKEMEHNYDNDPDFLAKKEWLINFKDNFEINTGNRATVKDKVDFFLYSHNVAQLENSLALKKIKRIFRENKKTSNHFNNQNLNIAIHIRRSNSHDSRIDGTDTPDYIFLAIINKLRVIYSYQNPVFHIYSQGNNENFEKFKAVDTILHLNESIEESFISMVCADILVTSRSTFSYTAGILSEGIIYYIPFNCARFLHWISIDELLK